MYPHKKLLFFSIKNKFYKTNWKINSKPEELFEIPSKYNNDEDNKQIVKDVWLEKKSDRWRMLVTEKSICDQDPPLPKVFELQNSKEWKEVGVGKWIPETYNCVLPDISKLSDPFEEFILTPEYKETGSYLLIEFIKPFVDNEEVPNIPLKLKSKDRSELLTLYLTTIPFEGTWDGDGNWDEIEYKEKMPKLKGPVVWLSKDKKTKKILIDSNNQIDNPIIYKNWLMINKTLFDFSTGEIIKNFEHPVAWIMAPEK